MPFFRTVGGHIIGTALPIFVRLHGGGDFLTSVVQSAYAMMYIFSPLLLGALAKRLGRRAALLLGSGMTIVDFVIYASLWNAMSPPFFQIIVTIFFLTRVGDATWNALYWPVIESRIADEKSILSDPYAAEIHVRRFNLSWNSGVVIANMVMTLATLAPTTEGILMGLFFSVCGALASVVVNFAIGLRYFRNIATASPAPLLNPVKEMQCADTSKNQARGPRIFSAIVPALLVIFIYGFTLQQQSATITNLLTIGAHTLVSFIPLGLTIRYVFVGISSSLGKLPEAPQKRFPRILSAYAGLMVVFGIAIALLPVVELLGLLLILTIAAGIGWTSGRAYSSSLMKIVAEGQCTNAHWFMALFEGIQSLGITLGGLMSGAITEVAPYWAPPVLNLVLILLSLAILVRFPKTSS